MDDLEKCQAALVKANITDLIRRNSGGSLMSTSSEDPLLDKSEAELHDISPQEKRNKAKLNRGAVLFEIILLQLPSVSITFTLFAIYIRGLGFAPTAEQLNILLVGAKLYEYLILGSLSSILLHRIRACLRSSRGVPLGLLTSPFQVSSSAYYLFGRQFWAAATRSVWNCEGDLTTKLYVFMIFLLAVAVGPSASIVMLPKLDWWQTSSPAAAMVTLINATLPDIYAEVIDLLRVDPACKSGQVLRSDSVPSVLDLSCPSAGVPQILFSLPQSLGVGNPREYTTNVTVTGTHHTRSMSLAWQAVDRDSAVAYATSPLDIVAKELHLQGTRMWDSLRSQIKVVSESSTYKVSRVVAEDEWSDQVSATTQMWQQPAVGVQCTKLWKRNDSLGYSAIFSLGPYAPLSVDMSSELLSNVADTRSHPGITVLKPVDAFPSNVSAAFVSKHRDSTSLCLVAAAWADSSAWMVRPDDGASQSSVSVNPSTSSVNAIFRGDQPLIRLSVEWVDLLDITLNITNQTNNLIRTVSAFDELHRRCDEGDSADKCLAIGMSLYLADALSRFPYYWDSYQCGINDIEFKSLIPCGKISGTRQGDLTEIQLPRWNLSQLSGIRLSYYSLKYVYGLPGFTAAIAWVVLLLHAVLVLCHLLEHVIRKKVVSDRGWSDVGQLVALALQTKASPLLDPRNDTMDDNKTWRLRVFLRDIGGTNDRQEIMLRATGTSIRSAAPNKSWNSTKGQTGTLREISQDKQA